MHVGILGGGNISATHARAAVAAGCQIAAVCGPNALKVGAIAREHGVPGYDSLEAFLSHRPMDLVAIGSPSGLHGAQIKAAADRRLHVLVEKPLEISLARIDAALADVRMAGVRLGVMFQDRLKPDLRRLKQLITGGYLGRPIRASARVVWYRPREYYGDSRWRGTWALDGGGALMNQGIHTVDALLWLLGPMTAVSARTATQWHAIEVEDTALATLEFASGALATLEVSTAAYPGYPRRIEITGTEGTAIIDGDRLTATDVRTPLPEELAATPATSTSDVPPGVQTTASQASPVMSDIAPHRRLFEDFVAAIQTHGEPACSGEEGRRSVAVVEAIYESARRGGLPGFLGS